MEITFRHNKKSLAVPVNVPGEVKLYAVPQSYSEDGYSASVWMAQELEPVPACAVDTMELLAHISVKQEQDDQITLVTVFCKEGVSYAA